MSGNIPGLSKPRIRTQSTKTTVASSIATATRSSSASSTLASKRSVFGGINYGINAQRSTVGVGLHNNYISYNSAGTSALRHQLNDNRTPLFNNIYTFDYQRPSFMQDNNSNKFGNIMAGVGMGVGAAVSVLGMLNELGIIGNTDSTPSASETNTKNDSGDTNVIDSGSFDKNSLSSWQSKEASINEQISNFGNEYSDVNRTYKENIENSLKNDAAEGFKLAGIQVPDLTALDLNEITVNENSTEEDFEAAKTSISNDINEVNKFKDDTLGGIMTNLDKKKGVLNTDLRSTESTITKLESQLSSERAASEPNSTLIGKLENMIKEAKTKEKELKQNIESIEKAKTAVDKVAKENCDALVTDLNKQKERLDELKNQKSEIDKKQYELAEKQSKEFDKNKQEMDKLMIQINGAPNAEKKSKLVAKWNELADEMSTLYESLNSANGETFTNDKNKSVTISVNNGDDKYTHRLNDDGSVVQDDNDSSSGGQLSKRMELSNKINSIGVGQTITINGQTFKKGHDGTFTLSNDNNSNNLTLNSIGNTPFSPNIPSANELKLQVLGIKPDNMSTTGSTNSLNPKASYSASELIQMAMDFGQD